MHTKQLSGATKVLTCRASDLTWRRTTVAIVYFERRKFFPIKRSPSSTRGNTLAERMVPKNTKCNLTFSFLCAHFISQCIHVVRTFVLLAFAHTRPNCLGQLIDGGLRDVLLQQTEAALVPLGLLQCRVAE